eukprot:gene5733-biopygen4265
MIWCEYVILIPFGVFGSSPLVTTEQLALAVEHVLTQRAVVSVERRDAGRITLFRRLVTLEQVRVRLLLDLQRDVVVQQQQQHGHLQIHADVTVNGEEGVATVVPQRTVTDLKSLPAYKHAQLSARCPPAGAVGAAGHPSPNSTCVCLIEMSVGHLIGESLHAAAELRRDQYTRAQKHSGCCHRAMETTLREHGNGETRRCDLMISFAIFAGTLVRLNDTFWRDRHAISISLSGTSLYQNSGSPADLTHFAHPQLTK